MYGKWKGRAGGSPSRHYLAPRQPLHELNGDFQAVDVFIPVLIKGGSVEVRHIVRLSTGGRTFGAAGDFVAHWF